MEDTEKKWFYFILIAGIFVIFGLGLMIAWLLFSFQRKLLQGEIRLQKQLMLATIQSQEKESERIAQELHDEVNALLAAAKMQIAFLPHILTDAEASKKSIEETKNLLEISLNQVRNISHALSPAFLMDLGLEKSIQNFIDNLPLKTHFSYQVQQTLSQAQTLALYRIVLELCQNTIKYAQAENLFIEMVEENNNLHLFYKDDGIGIEKTQIEAKKGLGLRNIETRVKVFEGEWEYLDLSKGFGIHITMASVA
jgi:signal transduction histidine kinase